jgi:hypothetical protein
LPFCGFHKGNCDIIKHRNKDTKMHSFNIKSVKYFYVMCQPKRNNWAPLILIISVNSLIDNSDRMIIIADETIVQLLSVVY